MMQQKRNGMHSSLADYGNRPTKPHIFKTGSGWICRSISGVGRAARPVTAYRDYARYIKALPILRRMGRAV